MEVFAFEHFNKLKPSTTPKGTFYYYLSDESNQDTSTTAANLRICLKKILTKQMIYVFLTTMWDHTNG